jgi:hypothetical protein
LPGDKQKTGIGTALVGILSATAIVVFAFWIVPPLLHADHTAAVAVTLAAHAKANPNG